MLAELAHLLLLLGLGWAVWLMFWATYYIYDTSLCASSWQNIHNLGMTFACCCIWSAYVLLTWSFLKNDYSVRYIWEHSHDALPWYYRMTAVWGGHEGSWLLWLVILMGYWFNQYYSNKAKKLNICPYEALVSTWVVLGFGLFIIFSSNPFHRLLPIPPYNGQDLNPLLQDPGFLIHPPCLYLGYVGLCMPYIIAFSALLRNKPPSKENLLAIRQWAIWSWSWLTGGILLGSWWAYRELGWGGFWFWDPVENAALIPWLLATALIHQNHTQSSKVIWPSTTLWLCITGFLTTIMGTFLVRSGIVVSVHAFAIDPARGIFLLALFCMHATSAYTLWARRCVFSNAEKTQNIPIKTTKIWVELQMKILVVIAGIILLATVYPIMIEALWLDKISIGPRYYEQTVIPFIWILLFSMGMDHTKKTNQYYRILLVLLSITLAWISSNLGLEVWKKHLSWSGFITLSSAYWALIAIWIGEKYINTFTIKKIAHSLATMIIIIILVIKSYEVSAINSVNLHDLIQFEDKNWMLAHYDERSVDNYLRARLQLKIKSSKGVEWMWPEMRFYASQKTTQTKAAINPTWSGDWYAAIAKPTENGPFLLRLYFKPLQSWLWLCGVGLFLVGLRAWWRKSRQYGKE
ncbi:MAG: cytochrome c biogenesis protein CcsA [Pseudomonadota bacterium]|nr:cytochrome c biogenesis protein CcsA [Pseudomonadota bacterium]